MMNISIIEQTREILRQKADEKYLSFSRSLIPSLGKPMLGVRLPELRKIAKEISRSAVWQDFLQEQPLYFEEIMIQGMVIGYGKCSLEEKLLQIKQFISKIDNWSVCDSFCNSLKFTKQNQESIFSFLQPYFISEKEFEQRFAFVMAMDYFLEEPYLECILEKLNQVKLNGYYSQMAVAWCLSVAYVAAPQKIMDFLKNCCLDDFTYEKTLQKIKESRRVSDEEKRSIKGLRRKYS